MAGDVDGRGVSSVMTVESPSTGPGRSGPDDRDRSRWLPTLTNELNRPLSTPYCVLGWLASIGLFLALVTLFGGPSLIDSQESTYSTFAIAHGEISCAYPSVTEVGEPFVTPLYPLLAGGISAVARIGHDLPFPSATALGPGCRDGLVRMNYWFSHSGALRPTTWVGCAAWLALMAGVIAWLRASGRGRCGWEPVTLFVVAALLPVWMCVQTYFHPQDLLALGLALSALACARRDRWLTAGILIALAVLSQQFALLVAVPLFIVAPAAKKMRFAGTALLAGAVVVLPLVVLTSGRVLRAVAIGSGNTPSSGRTVLWETHVSGAAGVLLYRVSPLAVAALLSWWVVRRIGPRALEPVPLMSLVAVSLGLRLVFEANLFTYYFMALMVAVVLLEATRGSIRRTVAAWIVAMTVVLCRMTGLPYILTQWEMSLEHNLIPLVLGGAVVLGILVEVIRGGDRRNLWPWMIVVAVDLFTRLPGDNAFTSGRVIWFWQIVLVVPGLLLAAQPLRDAIRTLGQQDRHSLEALQTL
jgi:hypothetical protein